MADRDLRGPSTHVNPSDVTLDPEGPPDQDHQECASDADKFDLQKFLSPGSDAFSGQYCDWLFDNEFNKYLDQQARHLDERNSYSISGPSTKVCRPRMPIHHLAAYVGFPTTASKIQPTLINPFIPQ